MFIHQVYHSGYLVHHLTVFDILFIKLRTQQERGVLFNVFPKPQTYEETTVKAQEVTEVGEAFLFQSKWQGVPTKEKSSECFRLGRIMYDPCGPW